MKLTFDYYHNLEQVDLFLCNPDGRELFPLPGKSRNLTLRFNDLSELTFEVDSKITLSNNTVVDLEAYDYIQTKRLVYATNIGWFQISGVDEHDNGVVKYKTVKAESYQSVLKNKGFISEERVYCFYNPNDPHDDRYDSTKEDSIPSVLGQWSKQLGVKQALGQGLSEPATPYDDWTVTYIHSSLIYAGAGSKCRTFKESVTYGYDWMVNDVEEAFEVVILFDFMYKTIHVMTPNEVAQRVNVIYTFNNFMKSVDINEASEDIVTVLNCNGDNCDITAVNPTGTNYICDFSYFMDKTNYRWMSSALITKLEQWKAACDSEKDTYEGYVEDIRTLYQTATEKETLLQEMSLSLADLRTAQNKRSVLGSGTAGALCGIVTAETVNSYRTTVNGVATVVGGNSIKEGTDYHTTQFTGATTITAYQYSPNYNTKTRQWEWAKAGASMSGTADEIVAYNLSDGNTSGVSYWYFSDDDNGTSYCKLKSAVTVNKDATTSTYYCGGFDRYIAYVYPSFVGSIPRRDELPADDTTTLTIEDLISDVQNTHTSWDDLKVKYGIADNAAGTTIYTDKLSEWISLRESQVNGLNEYLCGYARPLNGYQVTSAKDYPNPTSESTYGQINTLQSQISAIANRLNILRYFADTPNLLRELNCYWIEGDYTNDNIAVLEETTPEEEIDLANELLDAGYIELSKVCQPRFSFSLDSVDATKQYEFKDQMRLLELGKVITIEKEEGLWYYPALLEISLNLDNSEEFSMTFANAMRLDDWGYTYADLISDASSTSRKVSANWQDILAYSKERAEISSLIKDPLDTTLRASFANMVNQEFTVDKNGILGRKKVSETSDEFEDEQVRLINNLLIFTDDNWETAKTALGKIYYTDDDGNQVTSYGLIAETIIGSLIMGERLKIKNTNSTVEIGAEGISIKKADGTVVFSAKPDGSLVVRNYASQSSVDSLEATLETVADSVSAKVSQTYGSSSSSFGWSLKSTGFYVYSNASTVMKITSSGLEVNGKITATGGSAGGWTISTDEIYKGSAGINAGSSYTKASLVTSGGTSPVRFYCGNGNRTGGAFVVLDDGSLYASAAQITGGKIILGADDNFAKIEESGARFGARWSSIRLQYSTFTSRWSDWDFSDADGLNMLTIGSIPDVYGTGMPVHGIQADLDVSDCTYFCFHVTNGVYGIGSAGLTFHMAESYTNCYAELSGTWKGSLTASSDRNLKNSIETLSDNYELLFDKLLPVRYKFNDGTSGRFHTGFIAQEVEEAIVSSGLTTEDAALFVRFTTTNAKTKEETITYGLRYDEFISLNTWQIQKLKARVAELEAIVAKLQEG